MSRAIIPGSFDPMTLGHKQVIAAAAAEQLAETLEDNVYSWKNTK